ncbi:MAG: 2-succinyl-5-enolpyruvyl-6-hydroxy-3-cyclohexene-1-carboxylic-acid synthase [Actinomycetota bacterium]
MSAGAAAQAFARCFVDELARAGLQHAFVSPGSRSAPLALALADERQMRVHVVLDERSAGFAALGAAKAARRPVAVLCTSGTAAANLHPAVVEAHQSRAPLLVLTADRPPELRDTGAPQTIDQTRLFGDAVRWFVDVGVPEPRNDSVAYWRSVAARACALASASPPGPVHVNVPLREPLFPAADDVPWLFDLSGRAGGAPWASWTQGPRRASQDDVDGLTAAIERAERGALVAGACDVEARPLLELARAAGWPILAEPTSGLRTGNLAVSTYDALLRQEAFARDHRPDLVVRLGATGISRALESWLPPDVPQVSVDRDGKWLDQRRSVRWMIAADPEDLGARVAARLAPRSSAWLESWLHHEHVARVAIDEVLDSEPTTSEPRTARDVAAALPNGSTMVAAASMPIRDIDWFMGPRNGLRVLANRGANGIDGFVSTASGVALTQVGGPVVAVTGDLSLLHDQSGLLLGHDGRLDATFVVINNGGGGVFSFLPQARLPEHFETLFATPQGVDLAALARLHGLSHTPIGTAAELRPALADALDGRGVHLLEVRTDRADNVALHEKLWRCVAAAI